MIFLKNINFLHNEVDVFLLKQNDNCYVLSSHIKDKNP